MADIVRIVLFVGRKTVTGWISKFGKKPFPGNPVFLSIFVRAGRSFAGRLISKNVEKTDFDPNAPGVNNGRYFGLPFTPEQARLVLMSVPWDVTTSYREGTAGGPDAILDASLQVDLYDLHNPDGWRRGIGTLPIGDTLELRGKKLREEARRVIEHWESGGTGGESVRRRIARVNEGSAKLNAEVYDEACRWLDAGKKVGLVGGDHSVPLGLIRAVAERNPGVGVLHVDAHADLRRAYEGFTYSHASIMYNVLNEAAGVSALVQVGVRDLCDDEARLAAADARVRLFDDYALSAAKFGGESWNAVCDRIIACLPEKAYVSFDIDGLAPEYCPHTGTPVPGGLSFAEAVYLLDRLTASGREVVGFDLCEVAPDPAGDDDWDANVGARMLYKLCNFALRGGR